MGSDHRRIHGIPYSPQISGQRTRVDREFRYASQVLPMQTRARFQQGDATRSPFYESFAHLLCAAPSTL
eukprot:5650401-Prymnesium_polylepis.1